METKDKVTAAIGAAAVIAALIGVYVTHRDVPSVNQKGGAMRATIDSCTPDQYVDFLIHCSGHGDNIAEGKHLWLVEESGGNLYPKEAKGSDGLVIDNGRWSNDVRSQGPNKDVNISLYIANQEANSAIQKWLNDGKADGRYPGLKGILGASFLSSVVCTLRSGNNPVK